MHSRPRILVVSYNIPRPDKSSGELRFVAILEILSEFWDIDFCVADSHAEWNNTDELIPYVKKLAEKGIRVLPSEKGVFIRAIRENSYAGGYFNLFWIAEEMMPMFKAAQPGAFTIVDSVDVHFAREETQAKLGAVEMSKVLETKKRELGVYRAADVAIAVSKDDMHLLSVKEGLNNVFLIPNIVREYPRALAKRKPIVVFIGCYAWYPNPEAVIWFTDLMWPAIHAAVPDAEFLIIGSDPTPEVLALDSVAGVRVLGYVPETKPYFETAAVSVAPLRVGGGMKGKVNEALAHGVPVVATSIGAQGFEAIHGKHMMIADDPEEFAASVIVLLKDELLQKEMGLAGQKLNSAICSYAAVKEKIREVVIHCNRLIPETTIQSVQNTAIPKTGKISILVKDFGYALQLLKREGPGEFLRRAYMYLKGQRLPDNPRSLEAKAPHVSAIEKPVTIRELHKPSDNPTGVLVFPELSETPVASIIIPVYNQWDYTYGCLDSILKNTGGLSYEVILADDNSTDNTKIAERYVQNIHIVRNEKNLGFLLNCNNAATFAKGKFLVFLNNDTLVQPEWLYWFMRIMEENPAVGMAGAKLMFPTGELQEAGGIVFRDGSATNYGRFDWPDRSHYNYVKDVDYCSGACICLRTDLWMKAGGFDPLYSPGYYEETDLAMQIRAMGYRTVYQPRSVVIHFDGVSHGTDLTEGVKSRQPENQQLFLKKWKQELDRNNYSRHENAFRGRDKSKHRHIVLLIVHSIATSSMQDDKQNFSKILTVLLAKGVKVIMLPEDFSRTEPEVPALEQKGIEVLYGRWYRENWWQWLNDNATNINSVVFLDRSIADKYTPVLKTISAADFKLSTISPDAEFDVGAIL
jgi:GT2 family glycosyltransferase/glycosyltransferase involved in cell wall biosynthesis